MRIEVVQRGGVAVVRQEREAAGEGPVLEVPLHHAADHGRQRHRRQGAGVTAQAGSQGLESGLGGGPDVAGDGVAQPRGQGEQLAMGRLGARSPQQRGGVEGVRRALEVEADPVALAEGDPQVLARVGQGDVRRIPRAGCAVVHRGVLEHRGSPGRVAHPGPRAPGVLDEGAQPDPDLRGLAHLLGGRAEAHPPPHPLQRGARPLVRRRGRRCRERAHRPCRTR